MAAVFPIQSHADITKAISFMHTNYTKALEENKPLVVRIDQKEDKLSDAQRRLYWPWMTEYGKQRGLDKRNRQHSLNTNIFRSSLIVTMLVNIQKHSKLCVILKNQAVQAMNH